MTNKFNSFDKYIYLPISNYHYLLILLFIISSSFASFKVKSLHDLKFEYQIILLLNSIFIFLFIIQISIYKIFKKYIFLWFIYNIYNFSTGTYMMILNKFDYLNLFIFLLNFFLILTFFEYKFFFLLFTPIFFFIIFLFYTKHNNFSFLNFHNFDINNLGLILSCFLAIFVRSKTRIIKFSKIRQSNLEKTNKIVSDELLKARDIQEQFIKNIDEKYIQGFLTLYQTGKDLRSKIQKSTSIEEKSLINNEILQLINQNQFLGEYLLQVIYKIKDHKKLDVKIYKITEFLKKIKIVTNNLTSNLRYSPKIFIHSEISYEIVECDINDIIFLIEEQVKFIYNNSELNSPILIILKDTKLNYKVTFMKKYLKTIDALKVIISNDINILHNNFFLNKEDITFSIMLPYNTYNYDGDNSYVKNILYSHYGIAKKCYNDNDSCITQVFVIPQKLREIRPKVMDI